MNSLSLLLACVLKGDLAALPRSPFLLLLELIVTQLPFSLENCRGQTDAVTTPHIPWDGGRPHLVNNRQRDINPCKIRQLVSAQDHSHFLPVSYSASLTPLLLGALSPWITWRRITISDSASTAKIVYVYITVHVHESKFYITLT